MGNKLIESIDKILTKDMKNYKFAVVFLLKDDGVIEGMEKVNKEKIASIMDIAEILASIDNLKINTFENFKHILEMALTEGLMDKPKPYRKDVLKKVSLTFNLSDDFNIYINDFLLNLEKKLDLLSEGEK